MKIGIDFDRVLFRTDQYKKDLEKEFPDFGETYDQARKEDFYNLEKHAEIMDVDMDDLLEEMGKCREYLYEDIYILEELRKEHEVIIVTRGDPVLQKEKLENSGILEHVDGYEIVTEGNKEVAGIEFLVDDWRKEIERTDLPGIVIDRDKDGLEKILRHLTAPEFEEVFKRYDIRGRYPEELNEYFAYRLGRSLALFARNRNEDRITVTRDPKESSINLKKSLIKGIINQGIDVTDCGTGPTDYTSFSAAQESSIGVQVTSSHMPLNFNGFKMVYPAGNGFMNPDLDKLKQVFRRNSFETKHDGKIRDRDFTEKYLEKMEDFCRSYLENNSRKIVLDNLGGRRSSFAEDLLKRLGFEVENLAEESPRLDPPDPEPENLEHLEKRVEKKGADLGLATDMDSDRLAVYFNGEWLSGDQIFAALIEVMKPEKVVASIDSTEIVERAAEKYGEIEYTRVGDPFVIDRTLEVNAKLSGEPNGHYCFTEFVPYNSGTLAAAIIAGANLDRILDEIPEIQVEKQSVDVGDKHQAMDEVRQKVRSRHPVISEIDGIKYEEGDSRVLIRSSGSSDKLRVVAEAEQKPEVERACREAAGMIRNT